jgi:hypothetical protein
MSAIPKNYPSESKRGVVTVARHGELTAAEVAVDTRVADGTVRCRMRKADVDDAINDGQMTADCAVGDLLLRQQMRRLDVEHEDLRRAAANFASSPPTKAGIAKSGLFDLERGVLSM